MEDSLSADDLRFFPGAPGFTIGGIPAEDEIPFITGFQRGRPHRLLVLRLGAEHRRRHVRVRGHDRGTAGWPDHRHRLHSPGPGLQPVLAGVPGGGAAGVPGRCVSSPKAPFSPPGTPGLLTVIPAGYVVHRSVVGAGVTLQDNTGDPAFRPTFMTLWYDGYVVEAWDFLVADGPLPLELDPATMEFITPPVDFWTVGTVGHGRRLRASPSSSSATWNSPWTRWAAWVTGATPTTSSATSPRRRRTSPPPVAPWWCSGARTDGYSPLWRTFNVTVPAGTLLIEDTGDPTLSDITAVSDFFDPTDMALPGFTVVAAGGRTNCPIRR